MDYFRWIILLVFVTASSYALADEQIYNAGGDVKPPKLVHYVEPESSSSSQEAYVEGVVRLSAVVNIDGVPGDLKVTKGLNADEDRLAL